MPSELEGCRAAYFLKERARIQRSCSDARFAIGRPVSSDPAGFWYSPERQTTVEFANRIASSQAGFVSQGIVPETPVGAAVWSAESGAVPDIGSRAADAPDRLSAAANADVADGLYSLNSSAFAKTVVPLQVSTEEEALRGVLKRAAVTKHVYTALSALGERSGPEAVDRLRRAALSVIQSPLDSDNLPPILPTAQSSSEQTDRIAFFWETLLGHTENVSASSKLVELVSSVSKSAEDALDNVKACSSGASAKKQSDMIGHIVDEIVFSSGPTSSPVPAGGAAGRSFAAELMSKSSEVREAVGGKRGVGESVILNRMGLRGLLTGTAEQSIRGRSVAFEARMHREHRGSATVGVQVLDGEYFAADSATWRSVDDMSERKPQLETRFFENTPIGDSSKYWDGPVGGGTRTVRAGAEYVRFDGINSAWGAALRSTLPNIGAEERMGQALHFDRSRGVLYVQSASTTRDLNAGVASPEQIDTTTLGEACIAGDVLRSAAIAAPLGFAGASKLAATFGLSCADSLLAPSSAMLGAAVSRVLGGVGLLATYTAPTVAAAYVLRDPASKFGRALRKDLGFALDKHGGAVLHSDMLPVVGARCGAAASFSLALCRLLFLLFFFFFVCVCVCQRRERRVWVPAVPALGHGHRCEAGLGPCAVRDGCGGDPVG